MAESLSEKPKGFGCAFELMNEHRAEIIFRNLLDSGISLSSPKTIEVYLGQIDPDLLGCEIATLDEAEFLEYLINVLKFNFRNRENREYFRALTLGPWQGNQEIGHNALRDDGGDEALDANFLSSVRALALLQCMTARVKVNDVIQNYKISLTRSAYIQAGMYGLVLPSKWIAHLSRDQIVPLLKEGRVRAHESFKECMGKPDEDIPVDFMLDEDAHFEIANRYLESHPDPKSLREDMDEENIPEELRAMSFTLHQHDKAAKVMDYLESHPDPEKLSRDLLNAEILEHLVSRHG